MADGIEDKIRENAEGPRLATGDGWTAQAHSLPDQIAADRYLASKAAVTKKNRGLRFTTMAPPGAAERS